MHLQSLEEQEKNAVNLNDDNYKPIQNDSRICEPAGNFASDTQPTTMIFDPDQLFSPVPGISDPAYPDNIISDHENLLTAPSKEGTLMPSHDMNFSLGDAMCVGMGVDFKIFNDMNNNIMPSDISNDVLFDEKCSMEAVSPISNDALAEEYYFTENIIEDILLEFDTALNRSI